MAIKLVTNPMMPTMKKSIAIPEPFPVPKNIDNACPSGEWPFINGSNTWSARNPPRNSPTGIVLY